MMRTPDPTILISDHNYAASPKCKVDLRTGWVVEEKNPTRAGPFLRLRSVIVQIMMVGSIARKTDHGPPVLFLLLDISKILCSTLDTICTAVQQYKLRRWSLNKHPQK